MVKMQVILLLSFLVLAHCASTAAPAKDKLQILTISDKPQSVSKPIYSSTQGGKNIYINLIGHTMVASDISVTVGKYPCKIIADGVNSDFIVCSTTNCTDSTDYNKELLVTVAVASKKQVDVTKSPFSVYYQTSVTPKTTEIFPASNYAGQTTAVEGMHKSSDVGSGQSTGNTEIKIGDSVGDRSNVTQNAIGGYSQNQKIVVKQNQDNEAGKKNITEKNNQYGNSDTSPLKKASLEEDQKFHYTTLPAITNVTNKGSEDGHQIEIKGTGFSANNTRNKVTVDGQTCKITQSSSNSIKCILEKKDDNSTSILETNTTLNQSNGYISGVGLNYSRYNSIFAYDILQWAKSIKNSTLLPAQVSIKTELKSPDTIGSYTGEIWKGYFKVPVNGTYTFRGWAQYSFAMFFAKVHGSTQLPQTPLIYSNTPQNSWDSFFYDDIPTASASVELIQDYSYYIQVYHLSYNSNGKFKISVEVPNNKSNLDYQVYPVAQITLNTTVQPEVMTFNMVGGSGGIINLKIVRLDNKTLKVSYNRTVNITYGCSQAQFINAFNQFDCYQSYIPSVIKTMYDSSGSNTTDLTKAVRIEYNVSLYVMRPASCQTQKFTLTYYNYKGKLTQAQTVKHSPLINGTFGLKLDGSSLNKGNISYDVSSSTLKGYFQQFKGMENIIIDKITNLGCTYECKWVISFKGYYDELPAISFDTTKLTGGSKSPKLYNKTIRNFSRNVVFQPVDYRFLHTASSLPNVLVSVNQIPAVCLTNCTYQFLKLFKIVSLSQNGSILNIQVANVTALSNIPLPQNLDISQIFIKADDVSCSIIASLSNLTAFNFTCQLPTNFDGSPLLPAGEHQFKVYIPSIGYIGLANGVLPITVKYTLNSLKITNGTLNGGFSNSIFGSGFTKNNKTINTLNDQKHQNKNKNERITISICGNTAHITFISNKQIDFIQPPCSTNGTYHLNVTFGQASFTNLTFTYLAVVGNLPTISSISPKNSNPMVKSTLNISGSDFGTNLSALNVYLTNSSGRVYQLKVIKMTSTLITCGLPGGLPGNYSVQLNYPYSTGDALVSANDVNLFSFVSQITGVYPNYGSFFGGTLLTIVGTNFSPAYSDTLVYIGDTVNWFCKIQSINDTVITCLTPPISRDYQVGEQQEVYVSTKLTYFSKCTGNCSFSYVNLTDSPLVSNISLSYNTWGVLVTVNGTGLTQVSGCTFRFRSQVTGKITDLPALNCFNTTANITLPNTLAAGKYWVSILDDLGQGNPSEITLSWLVGNITTNTGSTEGFYAYINGSFYPPELDLNYRIEVTPSILLSQEVKVLECCSNNSVKLYFPPAPHGTYFILNFISPVGTSQISYYAYSTSTPYVKIMSPTNLTVAPGTISFRLNTSVNFAATATNVTLESTINKNEVVTVSNFNATSTNCNFTATLPAGSYRLKVNSSYGYFTNNPSEIINVTANIITSSTKNISFAGGNYTIYGNTLSPSSYLNVNDYKAYPINYNSTAVTYKIPTFVTLNTQVQFKFSQASLIDLSTYQTFSDQNVTTYDKNPFDGSLNTIYQSKNDICWFGIDLGSSFVANISRVKFFPKKQWPSAIKLLNASVQGSNDKTNWTNIVVIDSTVHTAWNNFLSLTNSPFRYIRFLHNSTSACNIAELQLYGIVYNVMAPSLTNTASGMVYNDGYNSLNLSAFLNFRSDCTPIIESLSQQYGDVFGGYNLTLFGSNLGFSNNTSVLIDNIPCTLVSSNTSQITCLVGARPKVPSQNTFTVIIDNNVAIIRSQFLYVLKWSDDRTWGVDLPPVADDIVFVPAGMALLVDQSTPKLAGIAVQNGTIIFANNTDITVNTAFIDVVGGQFIAGTEQQPLHSNLTFILYGGYYDAQQPIGGNKMIFCLECKFSMYGKPKKTWTTLADTVLTNQNVIALNEDVDWSIGDQIVVASTSFNPNQAEMKTVVKVNGRNVTVDTPFKYPHLSVKETYTSGDSITMSAEVGLLTRNIKIKGDPTTNVTKYGAHLMLYGQSTNGFEGKVAYSEFTMCGQPQIPGRYCIYFHNNGESFDSYAKGNSVYESYGRVVTIHAGHFITVDGNVGYRAAGHNFYLQDGIQTNNLIQNNLAINSLSVNNMMQSDIMVASFYIRHPNNYFIGNRAAGSPFYGFLFNLPSYPTGSSASKDVCPQGSKLGSFVNNVDHSNKYYGLRVTNLYARTNPCAAVKNEYLLNDLWTENPSLPTFMHNFTAFKNQMKGVVLQNTGNLILNNFTVAQNPIAGIEFYLANFTKQFVVVMNSVVIGKSQNNADNNSDLYSKLQGLVSPRSGSINVTNVRFYSFPSGGNAFVTCSQCNDYRYYTNIGNQIFVQGLKFSLISGKYLAMLGGKRDIIYDSDGSLSQYFDGVNRTKTTLIAKYPHIYSDNPNHCFTPSNTSLWDDTWLCDSTLIIRRIMITNLIGQGYYSFNGAKMYVAPIQNQTVLQDSINSSSITSITSQYLSEPLVQKYNAFSMPYVAGTKYNVWFSAGDDFQHLSISASTLYKSTQPGIIFKFAYKISRQLYNVGPRRGGSFPSDNLLKAPMNDYLQVDTCQNGEYYHNNDDSSLRMFEVCQSGKNKTVYEYTQVNGIFCKYTCPAPNVTISSCNVSKQTFIRRWSNASQWPNGLLPKQGDNVTISCKWTMMIDVNPPALQVLIVDGILLVDDTFDINITAKAIHIRSGTLNVGTNGSPFQHKFVIQINGNREDGPYYIDPFITANKFFVITGALSLNGPKPDTQITYLTQTALKDTTTIFVGAKAGWKVGDQITLSPSFSNAGEFEKVKISAINSDGSLTVQPPLKYTHYGASSPTISQSYGTLDARTRVGHLTRNIKIVSGGDQTWGFAVYVYAYNDGNMRLGNAAFNGVQFVSGGQEQVRPSLQFLNLVNSIATSSVVGSSFHNCLHSCLSVQNSKDISITSNVFYNIRGAGASMSTTVGFTFEDNLIVGVVGGSGTVSPCCFSSYSYVDLTQGSVNVHNNFCQGSQGYGFIIPHISCDDLDLNPFSSNTAGSCNVGFIFNSIGQDCQASSYLSAYACNIGQVANPQASTIKFSKFILADNKIGAILKFGNTFNSQNNTAFFQNSYITALSRPSCAQCYNTTACSGLTGLRMLTVTSNAKTVQYDLGLNYDIVDNEQLLDAKAYLTNVTFDSFRQEYSPTTYPASISTGCSSNFALKTNPYAVDMVGGHYLFNTKCDNCDNISYIYCDALGSQYLGLSGGCGDILCTGKSNYIVMDWNGTFFGNVNTVIPNNPIIGNNEPNCTAYSSMNGHLCNRSDFVILEYESTAPDYNSRIMWPVSLTANNSNYTTIVNGWREWNWEGSIPSGTRLGRFVSLIKLYSVYNLTFSAMPPLQLKFKLQRRTPNGNNAYWTMVKLYYPLPNSIEVKVGGQTLLPIIMTNTDGTGLRRNINVTKCGDNIFFFSNKTIQFVITEDPDCVVTISLSDSIQLTTHFAMNASDFFSNTVMSSFLSNLCALLNIQDQSRVKVVGVYAGSAIVSVYISANGSAPAAPGADPNQQTIASTLSQSISNGSFAASMSSAVGYQVITASSSLSVLPDLTQSDSGKSTINTSDPKFIISIVVGAVLVVFGVIVLMCYLYKKYMNAKQELANIKDEKEIELDMKEQSHAIIMSEDVIFNNESTITSPVREETPQKKQKRNRRVRQRQTLQIRQFD